ncbi:hypothetical protein [Streptosporangium sp. NPDC051022]|uniref:hypothetical protein n=1 Tax=Streptosporangium sp. NPDC051022 TaxID=3155752 RepID=UPI0034353370
MSYSGKPTLLSWACVLAGTAVIVGAAGFGVRFVAGTAPDPPPFVPAPADAASPGVSRRISPGLTGSPERARVRPPAPPAVLVPPAGRPADRAVERPADQAVERSADRAPEPSAERGHRVGRAPKPMPRTPPVRPPARRRPVPPGPASARPDPCAAFGDFRRAYCRAVLDRLTGR